MMGRLILLSAMVSAAGCANGTWTVGLPDDGPLPAGSVPNGVVLVTGPASWQEAAQQTTMAWDERVPDGVSFDSAALQEVRGAHPMMSHTPPTWEGAVLRPGHVALDVSPAGLHLDIDATLEPVTVSLEQDGMPACDVEVAILEGRLQGTLALTQTKLGVVNVSPQSDATFREGDAEVTISTCHDDFLALRGTPHGPEELALAALASAAFDALAPSLASALPARLGLNLAGAMTQYHEDGGLGTGSQHTVIRAPMDGPTLWWQLASGRLVVPYSVGVSLEPHPCAPAATLPVALSAAVPTVDSEWGLLVNQGLVARQLTALWSAGGLCGDRLAGEATWTASEWHESWAALTAMDPSMSLSVRAWPGSAPSFSFEVSADGEGVHLAVEAGEWDIELMGWRDGARVRLATLRAAIAMGAAVTIEDEGTVWLTPEDVSVVLLEGEPGLLSLPTESASVQMVEAIVREVVESSPLRGMLSLPVGLQPVIELHGAYLVIRDT
ncbi:MAG: hypothetical protein ACPGU1_04030 [Myxococcota bacterium]